jgi:UDP-N-acetylglucosamine transferase subunit ALG13
MTRLVLALTGTDHHPFDRMVRWIDAAASLHPDVHFVVQYGAAHPPRVAEGHDFLAHDRLTQLLAEASVVVCHGGPGTVTEARDAGHIPLCMPRDPRLGEHVDGHQQRFAALVAGVGVVREVTSQQAFEEELVQALMAAPAASGGGGQTGQVREAARALAAVELNDVMTAVRPHVLGRRRAQF